ncbi:MAG: MtrB/PioB family outer membrane beta-barrel protein [Deltaproteobacteria bacterium]|nr:MtrB/PioB family outer membrane beta-barrel protein [Deltaproteobacteria bacterium]
MKGRVLRKLGLWIIAWSLLAGSPAGGQEAEDAEYFRADVGAYLWVVDEQEEKFKELEQRTDDLTGGIESLGYDRLLGDDWLLHFTGRLEAEKDAGADVVLEQTDRWKFDVGYNTLRSYQNNAAADYDFGPRDNQLSRSIDLDREQGYIRGELKQPGLPVIHLGYERRTQKGARLLMERGDVGFFSFTNLPLFQEVDTDEHVANLAVRHTIAGVDVSFNQMLSFFHGSLIHTENHFQTGLGSSKAEERRERPDTFVSTSSLELSKHFMDTLYLSLLYRFQRAGGEGGFNKSVVDPVGGNLELDGESDVDIDNHSISLGARYVPLEYLTLTGELGYQDMEKRGTSDNLFLTPTDVLIVSEKNRSDRDDRSLKGNFEVRFSAIPRTTVDAGVEVSRIDRTYDDNFSSGRGFFDTFILDSDADLDRTEYWARVRIRPLSFIHLSARYGLDRLEVDFENDPISGRGPDSGIGDRKQRRTRTQVQARFTPLPILSATLSYHDDRRRFSIFSDDPDEIADTHARTYGVGLMLAPRSWITFSTQYTFQDHWANTRAGFRPDNVDYETKVHTWFNGLEISLRKGTRLLLDSQLSATDGEGQNAGGDGSLGSMSLDSTLQSYGLAVEHQLLKRAAVKAAFRYMEHDAEENFDHDDFSAYMVFVRLRIDMP